MSPTLYSSDNPICGPLRMDARECPIYINVRYWGFLEEDVSSHPEELGLV
jgi:hypothetical protein